MATSFMINDDTVDSVSILDKHNSLEISIKYMSSFSFLFLRPHTSQSYTKENISKQKYTH